MHHKGHTTEEGAAAGLEVGSAVGGEGPASVGEAGLASVGECTAVADETTSETTSRLRT